MRMVWGFYFRKGKVYVPIVARTEAGYYLNIEPVAVVDADDFGGVVSAIQAAIERGNPAVPTPSRANFPKPVVLRYAGVKSWPQFERESLNWSVEKTVDVYRIVPGRCAPDGGWVDDDVHAETLPPGTTPEAVAKRMARIIQGVAKDASERKA